MGRKVGMNDLNDKTYRLLKEGIRERLDEAALDFFTIGYYLRQISDGGLYAEDGYKNIWEFANAEYGLSMSSASRFMAINAKFSIDGGKHMDQKYIGMGVSKLQEMLSLPDEELEKVTKETTVREIRALKAQATKPLSFYGLPATKRTDGSLSTMVGCGDGKHDCFSCCRDCGIRQQERYCRTAPMGHPFPCDRMDEDFKKDIQHSIHRDQCQMLHPELAPVRAGDKEPDPCCLTCDIKYCFSRCDVAKKRDEQEQKDREAEERRKQREAEAASPEPDEKDIAAFYEYDGFTLSDMITADGLKSKLRNAGGRGGSRLNDFQGSARGLRINYKRELTWVQLAKALNAYQEKQRKAAEEAEPDIIDADFREVTDEPEAPAPMTDKEKDAILKEKEPDIIAAFYEGLYPGQKEAIKARKAADITKMLKKEYGEVYESGRDDNGLLWNCYPDKINLSVSGLCRPLQVTWGKFTTKLIALLNERPELEAEQRPEKPGPQQEQEAEQAEEEEEEDPEEYALSDVRDILREYERNLQAYRDAEAPETTVKKFLIIRDALHLLCTVIEEEMGQ